MPTKTKTIIATQPLHKPVMVALRHPLNHCPAAAEQVGYYQRNGRAVGLVLQFADGHRASLTYTEIRELQRVEDDTAVPSQPALPMV